MNAPCYYLPFWWSRSLILAVVSAWAVGPVSDAAVGTGRSGVFTVDTRGRLFSEWAAAVGLPAGVEAQAVHEPTGRSGLIAYAFGWSAGPGLGFQERLPRWERQGLGDGEGSLVFRVPGSPALDVRWTVEASPDLKTWTRLLGRAGGEMWTGSSGFSETILPDGFREVRVSTPVLEAGEGARYFRVRLELLGAG